MALFADKDDDNDEFFSSLLQTSHPVAEDSDDDTFITCNSEDDFSVSSLNLSHNNNSPHLFSSSPKKHSRDKNVIVSVRARPLSQSEILEGGHHIPYTFDETRGVIEYHPQTESSNTTGHSFSNPTRTSQNKSFSNLPVPHLETLRTSPMSKTTTFAEAEHKFPKKTRVSRDAGREHVWNFDHVFGPLSSTEFLYDSVAEPLIQDCMRGINGTIFAYGQTSSGKTYTMLGESKKRPGIIPLAVNQIFRFIKQSTDREFVLRVSFFEIYNEVIHDLLAPERVNLKIREDKKMVWIGDLKEEVVVSPEQVMGLCRSGEEFRHIGSTDYNVQSSRSHTIFRMVIESKQINDVDSPVRVSVLNLIDLAGSERISLGSESIQVRRTEGSYINKSLLTLAKVISKLSLEPDKIDHIPYRDSKLTRILQPSLGGNSKIAVICTISPSVANFEETNSTLKFASRTKKMKNQVTVNELLDEKALIKKYKSEIEELKKQLLEAQTTRKNLELTKLQQEKEKTERENIALSKKLQQQEILVTGLQEKIKSLTKLILVSANIQQMKTENFLTKNTSKLNCSGGEAQNLSKSTENLKPKQVEDELTRLQIENSTMKSELESKDQEIHQLKESLKKALEIKGQLDTSRKKQMEFIIQQLNKDYIQRLKIAEEKLTEKEMKLEVMQTENKFLLEELNQKK